MSHRPKPTAQKKLEGNPGRRPINAAEPQLPPQPLELPPELLEDEAASREYARLLALLSKAHAITQGEHAILIALCQQWSRYLTAHAKINADGMVIKSPNGYPMPNPYIAISNKALGNCLKCWIELGLTPSARSKVTTTPGAIPPDDPFSEFDQPTGAH